jgi:beta-galactosidase/beta-glucuronidase
MVLDNEECLHPRPQLRRARWTDLCGEWDFQYDDDNEGLDEHWYAPNVGFGGKIVVPFPPESSASGVGDTSFHPVVWYRRTFDDVRADADERLLLHFGAVDYRAQVWVDGQHVASHEGGHSPFVADITRELAPNRRHEVVVRAEDFPSDRFQPRGKQDWLEEPHEVWYHRTTGIWQPVWLEPVPHTYVKSIRWVAAPEDMRVRAGVTLHADQVSKVSVLVRLTRGEQVLAEEVMETTEPQVDVSLEINDAPPSPLGEGLSWSPEHPTLIDAHIEVVQGARRDTVESYLGIRSVGVKDGRFALNGEPYYLRLVLEQGYWPGTHLAAPSPDALRAEVELIRELGFNGARVHQKVEDPRFLYWCDRLGLIVWGEMANAVEFSPAAIVRLTREWTEVVQRDWSHPSIVAWVPINESWGFPDLHNDPAQQAYVKAIYFLTKALDPTRVVVANDGWEYIAGDLVTVHDYAGSGAELFTRYGTAEAMATTLARGGVSNDKRLVLSDDYRGRPVLLTEFGGLTSPPEPGRPWFGYSIVASRAELEARLSEVLEGVAKCSALSGFCYTQLTDTWQETNGLTTEHRVPKIDPARCRIVVSGEDGANSMAMGA